MARIREPWIYKGINVFPASANSSGIRWSALHPQVGTLRTDTKFNMCQLISAQEKIRTTKVADINRYKIVRHYYRGGKRVIERGLTLEQAQAHCANPETSSKTATSATARQRTKRMGPWFDGYDRD